MQIGSTMNGYQAAGTAEPVSQRQTMTDMLREACGMLNETVAILDKMSAVLFNDNPDSTEKIPEPTCMTDIAKSVCYLANKAHRQAADIMTGL